MLIDRENPVLSSGGPTSVGLTGRFVGHTNSMGDSLGSSVASLEIGSGDVGCRLSVRFAVGIEEGFSVGIDVGLKVGVFEGLAVGDCDGSTVGELVASIRQCFSRGSTQIGSKLSNCCIVEKTDANGQRRPRVLNA